MSITFEYIEGHDAYQSTMAFFLYELDHKFFPTPWTQEAWSGLFVDHNRFLGLAIYNEQVVGFTLFDLSVADSFAHLLKILIIPEYRGRKLSSDLLKLGLDVLKNKGIKHFFLEVEEDNIAAQSLYLASGFKTIHRKKDFYGQGRSALIMTLDLQ